ncbi:sensor histidine kinase [Devosia rhizoryzae]|uniref:histidine kinase n=1 Tax=Devosia rhizoryzae TaxID=2774137 RepID=A0ABX7C5D0_9HYPH|nr:sensor histidine kinase [Devosia rhizoryzae]QQR39457.1 sensor histidine kinase [Devosia rhizoryzae]
MAEELRFTADAALIDRLGRELVGKQETALIELVKNSYDADAQRVRVDLTHDRLVIDDDGVGMNREELVGGFLRLASDMKVRHPLSSKFLRHRAGRKGIGRFSTQRLGSSLRLRTWKGGDQLGLELRVDWRDFERGLELASIPVYLEEIPPRHAGTEIEIGSLRDGWTPAQIRRCWRGVMNLLQPFPVAPIDNKPQADPGFEVEFYQTNGLFSDPELVANFQTEILDHMHAVVEFRVDENGRAEWRLTDNKFGEGISWTAIHHEHSDGSNPPNYQHLHNAWMKAYYAILDPEEFSSLIFTRVRETLVAEGGIRLYRNDFRVVPYGEADNDWLRLDEIYGRRTILVPVANRNWFGVIEVRDPEGQSFEEHTSREGLIETPAFSELRGLATAVLLDAAQRIAAQRGRKTRAGGSAEPTERFLNRLREAVRKARELDEGAFSSSTIDDGPPPKTGSSTVQLMTDAEAVLTEAQAIFADELAMLRLLATLGLTAAEFSHETGMTFQAVRLDFKQIFDVALNSLPDDDPFIARVERARSMLDRLDALTSYLNQLASARSARQLSRVSVSRVVEEFEKGVRDLAARSAVNLTVDTPPIEPLYTRPMHSAEVASLLLNFYSNAIKAIKETTTERRMHVEASSEGEEVVIRFSDTGEGIPEENREKIFDLFFTTRSAAPATATALQENTGTGLGLWIVHQIVTRANGTVEVVQPPEGFVTCIEVRLPAYEDNE